MPSAKIILLLLLFPALGSLAEETETSDGIDVPIPLGIPMKGLKIPHLDDTGNEVMFLESDVAVKVDDRTIEFENLKIELLDDDGRKIFVELPESVFNLETRVLTGQKSAKIHREDFEINGETIEFNTRTKHGRMRGKVSMVITSTNDEP